MPKESLPDNLEEFLAHYVRNEVFRKEGEKIQENLMKELQEESEKRRRNKEEAEKLKALSAEHKRQAEIDPLTGLLNRRGFEDFVTGMQREGFGGALLFLDGDGFKQINDTYGHLEGDRVLKKVADYFCLHFRPTDGISRWGGDEFMIFCPGTDAKEILQKFVPRNEEGQQLKGVSKIEIPFRLTSESHKNEKPLTLTFSGGITNLEANGELSDALKWADTAMYKAKNSAKNHLELYEQ